MMEPFGGTGAASLILLDTTFEDVTQAVSEGVPGNGFFLFERVSTSNVTSMLDNYTALPFYNSWKQGPALQVGKPLPNVNGELPVSSRSSAPLVGKPRPHFGLHSLPVSIMDYGAKADGVTDDSGALQRAINAHNEVFLPHGTYLIAQTVTLAATTSLFGEGYSVLMASAANPDFAKNISDPAEPTPLLTMPVGAKVQLVDLTFMADGDVPGCLLVDWKGGDDSGMWDIMYRIEHAVWAQLRLSGTAGGYFENCWLWVADHIFDTGESINVTSPRGALIQSSGKVFMLGVAAEHSSEYQYFLEGAQDVTMVLTQSESPYWQNPPTALALKVHNSKNIRSYGGAYGARDNSSSIICSFIGVCPLVSLGLFFIRLGARFGREF